MSRDHLERLLARRVNRRQFIIGTGALAGLALAAPLPRVLGAPTFAADPFSLGVASGDPRNNGVVLWTRLAPDPLNGGGMPPQQVPVEWLVATDDQLRHVVRRGTTLATPELAHAVHVEVQGLAPERWYWYQFRAGDALSPVGRTRTAPPPGNRADGLRFAFASCQNYTEGFYPAYRNMAREDLDLVVHLGDYIYEGPGNAAGVRAHAPAAEIYTLDNYRTRYALYKLDPDLQAAHAAFPWLVTWDDHEVENNYADEIAQANDPRDEFLLRRAAAYQAYYEHQPLRRSAMPTGPDMQLYRRYTFGTIAEFNVLDTRQYRSDQPAGCTAAQRQAAGGFCPEAGDPDRTMLGAAQEGWLYAGLDRSQATWNVLAQQVRFARQDRNPDPTIRDFGGGDNWDGYVAERQQILDFLAARRPSNPVVITGDIHTNWVYDLKQDFDDPASPTVGAEFIGTSISSGGDPRAGYTTRFDGSRDNPHERFFNNNRGYVRCTLDRRLWRTDFRVVPTVRDPAAPVGTLASFVGEDGRPGVQRA